MFTFTVLIQPSTETSSMCKKSRKVNKRSMDQKKFLISYNMIFYVGISKKPKKKNS